jgi:uncharacterized protein YbaR (Trm112 family)
MICPHCKATLTQRTKVGEPVIRNRGIIMKADGPVLICPKCKSDVGFNLDLLKALPILIFRVGKP